MTSFDEHDQRARAQKYKQYAVAQQENALHTKPQVVATQLRHLDALLDHVCTKPQALVFSSGSLPQH